MKIFSSFDTDFKKKLVEKEKEVYKDKVYVISHGKFYYYFYIIVPTILLILGMILYFVVLYYTSSSLGSDTETFINIVWVIVFFVIFVPAWIKMLKKYIDYIMDFVIVTPKNLISYNQEWIFTRKWRTVDVEKIKTISVNKDGILRSLFNYGNIVILTEWDEKWAGEINFSFIDDPDNVKFKVMDIVEHWKN